MDIRNALKAAFTKSLKADTTYDERNVHEVRLKADTTYDERNITKSA